MTKQEIEDLKKLRDSLSEMIDRAEANLPYQSEVGKDFGRRLSEKMEKKDWKSYEITSRMDLHKLKKSLKIQNEL